jgi:anti-anti-sigma factor
LQQDIDGTAGSGPSVQGLRVSPTDDGMAVRGEVDLSNWSIFSVTLDELIASDRREIVVDVSELSFIDGHGMGSLVAAARKLDPDRRLILRGALPIVMRIADILDVNDEPNIEIEGRGE